ncbi:expressed unknown protein [Seminavis robusta]|uniref:Uncharacterized protein n=1 Tax=Seminavis robusta TaxID=568900 RepID=A0A9N8E5W0_9STRA|nr:expressed unknown protein [Seminavis robusta]|eukprot:Sro530_g161140.1 n/a (785) ;mRNA; f:13221-15853
MMTPEEPGVMEESQPGTEYSADGDVMPGNGDDAQVSGTILEAAFVDPAYQWPPPDGQGKNAIELKASQSLMADLEDPTIQFDKETQSFVPAKPQTPLLQPGQKGIRHTKTVVEDHSYRGFWCCKWSVKNQVSENIREDPFEVDYNGKLIELRDEEVAEPRPIAEQVHDPGEKVKDEKQQRRENRYGKVPEGILIYRLNTSTRRLELLSQPHTNTDTDALVRELVVVGASPSNDRSRRGMDLVGEDGTRASLVACEQRTAIAWLEVLDMVLGGNNALGDEATSMTMSSKKRGQQVEDQYLNLAKYSNRLIRAGKLDKKKSNRNAGAGSAGIYTSIELQNLNGGEEKEALESVAKRRAVIKDSWDFYRMICSLLRDKHKYDEVFRRMQLDPVYPYLNSMTGLNDPGDDQTSASRENVDKLVTQKDLPQYIRMTKLEMAKDLCRKAEETMPSLVEICKALAGSLGIEEVGVGPVKDPRTAIKKADAKYGGDLLKVTDYCRSLLVVKDFPSLLALLELARDSFGPLIRRVKMSSLKSDKNPKPGGYRDCIINLELKDHICEIQVHLWPLWSVCGIDGFRHYRHCVEYNTDSFPDPYDSLDGLDRKTRAELIVMAEEAVVGTPLENLEWYHEKHILDYFAEAGLFLKHGLDVWAETTLKQLIRLRTESPDIGPDHHETIVLYKYLAEALRKQGKRAEAEEAYKKVEQAEFRRAEETEEAEKTLWDSVISAPAEALEMIMDPNKKEREEEENVKREVRASKKQWRKIRQERFKFLDSNMEAMHDEKKDNR